MFWIFFMTCPRLLHFPLITWSRDLNIYYTLNNFLTGSVELTKNAESDKYVSSDYSIGFYSHLELSLTDGSVCKICYHF